MDGLVHSGAGACTACALPRHGTGDQGPDPHGTRPAWFRWRLPT